MDMLDTIRNDAAATEAAGRLAPSTVAALVEAGSFKLWVPEDYGGAGTSLQAGLDAIAEIARADGAAGWCVMIANTTGLLAARLDREVAHEIFARTDAVAGGFAAPMGVATLGDGAARVSGEWAWGSGSSHATTMGGGVRIVDAEGSPAALPDGGRVGFAFFAEVEELDTWHVSGLQGTHSTDYRVDNVHVPLERIVSMDRRSLVVDTPLYRFSTFGALALGVAMTMVGLAERAIEELTLLADKIPQGSSKGLLTAHLCRPTSPGRSQRCAAPVPMSPMKSVARGTRSLPADGSPMNARSHFGWPRTQQPRALGAVDRCYTSAGEKRSTADRRSSESSGTYMLRRNMRWLPLGYTSRSAVSGSASKPIPAGSSFRPSLAAQLCRPFHWVAGQRCRHESSVPAPCSR